MIARSHKVSTDKDRFLELLPTIQEQAHHAFRCEPPERQEEMIAEVVANAFVAFVRLVDRGLGDVVYPTPLARFAVRQVRSGRKVGGCLNVNDVSSGYAQKSKGFVLQSLDQYSQRKKQWKEILIEDRRTGPAQTAAARIDIGDWFASLPRKKRRIAEKLAVGESTSAAARKFHVSHGRISQVRRELLDNWQAFIADDREAAVAATA